MLDISVIVPVYNVEHLVERCLDSLINQSLKNIEIIVINDGSTDGSLEIVKKYSTKYPDLVFLFEQENAGLSETRNNGIKLSRGKYIYFIDSDDYIEPNTLETLLEVAQKNNADYVIDGFKTVEENGDFIEKFAVKFPVYDQVFTPLEHKESFLIHHAVWNRLYDAKMLKENELKFMPDIWYEDLLFSRQVLLHSKRAVITNHFFLNYVQREGSLMSSRGSDRNLDIIRVFEALISYYKKEDMYQYYESEIEFLALQDLYMFAVVRVSRASRFDLANEISEWFIDRYPSYRKNELVKSLPLKHKFLLKIIDNKLFSVIKILFR